MRSPVLLDRGAEANRSLTVTALFASCVILLCSCGHSANSDADSAAGRMGQAAHKLSKQADKAAQSMGKELKRAAHDAREGWKEEERKSREKGK